jgi:hypothetical protein
MVEKTLEEIAFSEIAARVPEMVQLTEEIYDWNLAHYTSHLHDENERQMIQAKDMLKMSARAYLKVLDTYSLFIADSGKYAAKRKIVESVLEELNNSPSAMWDVQPGA